MKNFSLITNVVLAIAVVVLYYLHFTGGKMEQEVTESEKEIVEKPNIVFINSDSLLANYKYLKDKKDDLVAKSEKLNKEFKNRAEGLQKEVNSYKRNANNMTIGQARAVEEDLMKKQQNLQLYEQSLTQQLMKEESKINQELYEKVSAYLKEYGDSNNLHLVVKYNQGSDILYANSTMDITDHVISGLNDAYQAIASDSTATSKE